MSKNHERFNFIWSIADLLRGPYRPPQYERVMLPLVVLRRFDCVLESTKDTVLAKYAQYQGKRWTACSIRFPDSAFTTTPRSASRN